MISIFIWDFVSQLYKYGFVIEIEIDKIVKGFSEEVVCLILVKKEEFDFLLQFWFKVFCYWFIFEEFDWVVLGYIEIDY